MGEKIVDSILKVGDLCEKASRNYWSKWSYGAGVEW